MPAMPLTKDDAGQLAVWRYDAWCNCTRCGEITEHALQLRIVGRPIVWLELCAGCLRHGLEVIETRTPSNAPTRGDE